MGAAGGGWLLARASVGCARSPWVRTAAGGGVPERAHGLVGKKEP